MVREPTSKSEKTKEVAKSVWSFLRTTSLAVSDGIIALSLMQKGTRAQAWSKNGLAQGVAGASQKRTGRYYAFTAGGKLPFQASHIDHITPVKPGRFQRKGKPAAACALDAI